jgi:organic radical activating enzyme
MMQDIPNARNFCGGNFPDWLEVNLIENCNAKCPWCIEKNGYHPEYHAPVEKMAEEIIKSGKTNIILLGGEPLLYKHIKKLISLLVAENKKVWITTNGFLLSPEFVIETLSGIAGANISIHHNEMERNKQITKIMIDENKLIKSIFMLHFIGASVRMNCNIIKDQIDTAEKIIEYVKWAKLLGADKIRFAELKEDEENFIDLAKILNYKYGLNDNPFKEGCNSDCVINDMPVNFRQMCGLNTTRRVAPINPKGIMKHVLYYDGKMYDGWQTNKKENEMEKDTREALFDLINSMTNGKLSTKEIDSLIAYFEASKLMESEVIKAVKRMSDNNSSSNNTGAWCQY